MTTQNHSDVAKHDAEQSSPDPTERHTRARDRAELAQVPVSIVGGRIGLTYQQQLAELQQKANQ